MPLFEYVCDDCGTAFEKIVPVRDAAVACVTCASVRVEKQLSVFAVTSSGRAPETGPGCGTCGAERPGACGM